jgi:predicted DCC family thiol-disulfide oxidoreductase YuxK
MGKKQSRWHESILSKVFGLDLRSLAAFRIGISLFVLYDLISRTFDLTAHYTDLGTMPRAFAAAYFSSNSIYTAWSPVPLAVHMAVGSAFWTALLFVIHAIAAVALLFGFRTRLMTFIVWYLLSSLHTRNPLVLSGADDLVRVFLFLSIFLPLGARYSVDAAMNPPKDEDNQKNLYSTPTSAVFYLQFICVYFFTALLKAGPEWRTEGTAIYYALNIDQYALPLGKILLGYPELMRVLTLSVWWVELLGTFLFLIPFVAVRMLAILMFTALYLGFGATLALGHFPWVNIIMLVPFWPAWVWDRKRKTRRPAVEVVFEGACTFCRQALSLLVEFVRPHLIDHPKPAQGRDMATQRREKSWIVRNAEGAEFYRFDGVIRFVSSSPFFWIAPVLRLKPCHAMGTAMYKAVERNRPFLTKLLFPLRWSAVRFPANRWREGLIAIFFVAVLIYNVTWFVPMGGVRSFIELPLLMTRAEQYWGMFAPAPNRDDGWFVVEGRLRNGSSVEAFKGKKVVSYEKPKAVSEFYSNERWRRYMMNIATRDFKDFRPAFTLYVCRNWNEKNAGPEHLDRLSVFFMQEVTPPPGEQGEVRKLDLIDFACPR